MKDPNWIVTTLAGAVIGWALPYIIKFVYYLFRRSKKDYLEGEWFGYHWTYKRGKPELNTSRWSIAKGIFHSFSVKYRHQDGMDYRGYAEVERAQLIVKIHSDTNQETIRCRLTWPIPSNANLLRGVWQSFDHDTKISSGAQILSRADLSTDEAIATIKKVMEWDADTPVIRVKEQ